ncbi:MAG TPA: hypothetical protein V6C58_24665 [Allocoleopsis sp.]
MRLDNETDVYCNPKINIGSVYYDEENNRILHLERHYIYFEPNLLFKIYSTRNNKKRLVRSKVELKEKMNESGYLYLGEL